MTAQLQFMVKKILILVVVLGVVAGIFVAMQLNKPHQKVEDAKSVVIAAVELGKQYNADEKGSDAKYLNKAIEVSGTISEVDKNQDGGVMVVLKTDDPASGIQCSMREKNIAAQKDQQVTIKGFCSGNSITGVSLTDCVIK